MSNPNTDIDPKDLERLKTAHDAYSKYPYRSRLHGLKYKDYSNLLDKYCTKYHAEPYQLRMLAGID